MLPSARDTAHILDSVPVTLTPVGAYQELILATGGPEPTPGHRPTLVMNGGQTGSGKSTMTMRDISRLAAEPGGVVRLDWDFIRTLLPASHLKTFHKHDPEKLQQSFPRSTKIIWKYFKHSLDQAIQECRNVHIDGILEPPAELERRVRLFHEAGYQVKLHVMMAHPHISSLGRIGRMAAEALRLQQALQEAEALPPEERSLAIASARRRFIPRFPHQRDHDQPVTPGNKAYQPDSLRHAERLLKEGLINEIELWEQNQPQPTWQARREAHGNIHIIQRGKNAGEQTLRAEEFELGSGGNLYDQNLQRWEFADLDLLLHRAGPMRSMLDAITLLQIDTDKYRYYLDTIEQAAQQPLKWQLTEQSRHRGHTPVRA